MKKNWRSVPARPAPGENLEIRPSTRIWLTGGTKLCQKGEYQATENVLVPDITFLSAAQNGFLRYHLKGQTEVDEIVELLWAPERSDRTTE